MLFWIVATLLTALACAALFYAAAGRTVNATSDGAAMGAHHRMQLNELEADIAAGRLGGAEAQAARVELAREVLRLKTEAPAPIATGPGRAVVAVAVVATAVIAFVSYGALGSPDLPSEPLEARATEPTLPGGMTIEDALARVEQKLATSPDDAVGWRAAGLLYMQTSRFADAANAYRRVLSLTPPTAELETDLATAILMQTGGVMDGEPRTLLQSAAARDPTHIPSRFYLAVDATQGARYAEAKDRWQALIAMSKGNEAWLPTAQNGLATAEAALSGAPEPSENAAIRNMVEGLDARLTKQGGSIEEWTQLVRSRLVLKETDKAKLAYEAAVKAYPDPAARTELDALATGAGIAGTAG